MDNVCAELMVICTGLARAWALGFHHLCCYSDLETAIQLIRAKTNRFHAYALIIREIGEMLAREWRVELVHTLRKGNVCADYL